MDGHGMNMEELGRNPRLDTKRVSCVHGYDADFSTPRVTDFCGSVLAALATGSGREGATFDQHAIQQGCGFFADVSVVALHPTV